MSTSTSPASRVALVTGGAQGLGAAIALRLADDGVDIAVLDLLAKESELKAIVEKIQERGRKAIYIIGDVTSEESVKTSVEKVVNKFGKLDIMVANAGIVVVNSLVDTKVEDWDKLHAVNCKGVMLCYKYAAIQMIKQGGGGRIIGASSTAGKLGVLNLSTYCSTKWAVRGLTQAAAVELRDHGITVNAYAPGFVDTSFVSLPGDKDTGINGSAMRTVTGFPEVANLPLPGPETVADLVSFIAKPSSFMLTGQTIGLNFGLHMD